MYSNSNYGGIKVDLMGVPLNEEFWVCDGVYKAYVVEEYGKRYLITPDAPKGLVKQEITEDRRKGLSVAFTNKKYIDTRSIKCEYCGKNIVIGYPVYVLDNSSKTYCSDYCLTMDNARVETMSVEIAEECGKELKY